MKQLKIALAVALMLLLSSCGTTRRVTNEVKHQQITSSVTTDTQHQSNTTDVANITTTETDFSKAVIEFQKIEYSDGTEDIRTGADIQRDTVKHRDREQTEPPNVPARSIKSITTGRVTIDKDKTKQTVVNEEKTEEAQTQTNISEQVEEDTQTKTKTEDKPKRGFFFWFGVASCIIIAVVIIIFILRAIDKRRRWQSD